MEDLLLIVKDIDIKSSVDDSTSFIVEDKTENLITSLEEVSNTLPEWIKTQESNRNKCHALFSTNKHLNKIAEYTVGNSDCEKLIVVKIDVNFKV